MVKLEIIQSMMKCKNLNKTKKKTTLKPNLNLRQIILFNSMPVSSHLYDENYTIEIFINEIFKTHFPYKLRQKSVQLD